MPILIKAGDTAPSVLATLFDADEEAVVLTGATVRFVLSNKDTRDVSVNKPAVNRQIDDGSDGTRGAVEYRWAPGDTTIAGEYIAEFEVTFADGAVQTFPTVGYIPCTIVEDLGGNV